MKCGTHKLLQDTVCSPAQLKCVQKIPSRPANIDILCMKSCDGLMITGYTKFDFNEYSRKEIQSTIKAYRNYKKWLKFPKGIKGIYFFMIIK